MTLDRATPLFILHRGLLYPVNLFQSLSWGFEISLSSQSTVPRSPFLTSFKNPPPTDCRLQGNKEIKQPARLRPGKSCSHVFWGSSRASPVHCFAPVTKALPICFVESVCLPLLSSWFLSPSPKVYKVFVTDPCLLPIYVSFRLYNKFLFLFVCSPLTNHHHSVVYSSALPVLLNAVAMLLPGVTLQLLG